MAASPRHRRDTSTPTSPIPRIEQWPPPVMGAVKSRAFDAVAPLRHPERYEPVPTPRDPSGDGPAQFPTDTRRVDPLSTVDDLFLAHS